MQTTLPACLNGDPCAAMVAIVRLSANIVPEFAANSCLTVAIETVL